MQKVFCLGFPKTGTTSLRNAFRALGYRAWSGHWKNPDNTFLLTLYVNRDIPEIIRFADLWDCFSDGPWGGSELYVHLADAFPESKFVHTFREPQSWYASLEQLIMMFDVNRETALESYYRNGMYGSAYFFRHIFGITTLANNRGRIIDAYRRHDERLRDFFASRKDRLLVMNMEEGYDWQPLCRFLDVERPSLPFPHVNKSANNPYVANGSDAVSLVLPTLGGTTALDPGSTPPSSP